MAKLRIPHSSGQSLDHVSLGLLGVVTICAYGAWYYSFGALLDTIRLDTGWRESALAASFSAGTVLIGVGSLFGGRLLDRSGVRVTFLAAGVGGGAAFLLATSATNITVFTIGAATGMGLFGACGFYHVTMTAAVRLHPDSPARAIAVLTIWGAFASAIYLPLTSQLLQRYDWRTTARILTLSATVAFFIAAFRLPPGSSDDQAESPPIRSVLMATGARPATRYFTLTVAMLGIVLATLLVYQVPAMTAAGLPLATATSVAGFRGICQLLGRLPLSSLLRTLGTDGALLLSIGAMAVGGGFLAISGTVIPALAFAVIAGFGIGAMSPLQGIKSEELFERQTLGATMGFYGTVLMLAGASGPVLTGVLSDLTGDRRWSSAIVMMASAIGILSVTRMRHHARSD